jgi:hypothetical protein
LNILPRREEVPAIPPFVAASPLISDRFLDFLESEARMLCVPGSRDDSDRRRAVNTTSSPSTGKRQSRVHRVAEGIAGTADIGIDRVVVDPDVRL